MGGGFSYPGDSEDSAILDELLERVDKMEMALVRMDKLEEKIAHLRAANSPGAQDFNIVVKQLKKVSANVDGLIKGIKNTPGYDAHRTFTCKSCGSDGNIATVLRCTKCGKDKWVGWWP